jgi:hypothetical protein
VRLLLERLLDSSRFKWRIHLRMFHVLNNYAKFHFLLFYSVLLFIIMFYFYFYYFIFYILFMHSRVRVSTLRANSSSLTAMASIWMRAKTVLFLASCCTWTSFLAVTAMARTAVDDSISSTRMTRHASFPRLCPERYDFVFILFR